MIQQARGRFIHPMLLLRTSRLPESGDHVYELKFDGYRSIAFKHAGKVHLRSRNDKDFNARYPAIVSALAALPDETVIDGEIVAMDAAGRPSFNVLQNYGSSQAPLFYYVFDLLVLAGRDVMSEPLSARREMLEQHVLPLLDEPIRASTLLHASLADLVKAVKAQGLEGLVAKRKLSRYEPGQRSGAWQKMRVDQGQEFVIGGYTPGPRTFDALIFGYYDGLRLLYAARTRNGFTPALREQLFRRFKGLETDKCPFVNLPETHTGRWGQGLARDVIRE